VIEDSQYGVQAARAAGMDVFAYDTGLVEARLLAGERTVLFSDLRDLPGMVSRRTSQRSAFGH
jgi:beta-phosphoglucomutase-like phosphatase (HAD superfamily)